MKVSRAMWVFLWCALLLMAARGRYQLVQARDGVDAVCIDSWTGRMWTVVHGMETPVR